MGHRATCYLCQRERWMLDGPGYGVLYCRFCDAAYVGNARYAGPPSLNFTDENGLFSLRAKGVEE